jgi:serine/threonine kinase PknH
VAELQFAGEAYVDGTPFGRYRLVALLGRGGMGEVWRAYDTTTDRTVAVKLLPPHLAEDGAFVQRFRREAHAAARLNSPHVIPIHDYGEIDGRLYVDMRLIEGRDLQSVLEDGPLSPGRAVRIIEQVAKALHAAHRVGLIHRDVKPSNILLDEDDFAYLIDFGIARATEDTRLTETGGMIGTFHYMAPERLGSGEVDARADIYALACVLYECLTGGPPFPADSTERLIVAHLSAPPPHPSAARPDVPAQFDEVIATGMAKDPDWRYATTVELAGAAHNAIRAIPTPIPRSRTAPTAPAQPAGPVMPTLHTPGIGQPVIGGQPTRQATPGPGLGIAPPPTWVGGDARPPGSRGLIVAALVAAVVLLAGALVAVVVVAGHQTSRPTQAVPASTQAAPSSTQPPASAEIPAMNGNYTARTWPAEGVANFTEMGWTITTGCTDHDGCTAHVQTTGLGRQCIGAVPCEDLKPRAPQSGDATLYGSSWTLDWDVPNGVQCGDGSLKGPMHSHFIWDAATLKGTKTSSWAAGLCLSTAPASSGTSPFSLVKA